MRVGGQGGLCHTGNVGGEWVVTMHDGSFQEGNPEWQSRGTLASSCSHSQGLTFLLMPSPQ